MHKLVLLPGMDGTGRLFAPFVKALPAEVEVQIVDFPRHEKPSYPELVDLVGEKISGAGSFVLLAESFSTAIAIEVAGRASSNLKGLVLCAGFARSPVQGWPKDFAGLMAGVLFRLPLPEFILRRVLLDAATPPSVIQAVKSSIASVSQTVLSSRLRSVLTCDVLEQVGKIAVPVLYLQGLHDQLIDEGCLREILGVKPDVEVSCVDGPHLLLQCKPFDTSKAVVQFMNRLSHAENEDRNG